MTSSPALFTPFRIRDVELANRIVVSPMCQYSAVNGSASDWHVSHLSNLAMSGASLVFVEATAVEARGRISPGDLGLYNDDNELALGKALAVARAHGLAKMGIQLAHAGRKASCAAPWDGGKQLALDAGGWTCIAPQALPFYETDRAPLAMDDGLRAEVRRAFVDAAVRAGRLGFDVVELHCAHGYLMHEHLSPSAIRTGRSRSACTSRSKHSLRCARRCLRTCRSVRACRRRIGSSPRSNR
jgi:2,4-dienoyl-CoA reductase-like NADH-dependent reductase (Old Yellow Enzyme family)